MGNTKMYQPNNSNEVDILMGQLKELSHPERVLLGLFYFEQLSAEEIAPILSMKVSQVYENLNRILPHLHQKPALATPGKNQALPQFAR